MSQEMRKTSFTVTDLKQWVYCPRILYYYLCLPNIRPTTYKMKEGVLAGQEEEEREIRRSLRTYGLNQGNRAFNVSLISTRLDLNGKVDMVITTEEEVIPVDYKMSTIMGEHFKLQVAAYGIMLEEINTKPVHRGFLYSIETKKAEEIKIDKRLRSQTIKTIEAMQHMLKTEQIPDSTKKRGKCTSCEFRRFCNDID